MLFFVVYTYTPSIHAAPQKQDVPYIHWTTFARYYCIVQIASEKNSKIKRKLNDLCTIPFVQVVSQLEIRTLVVEKTVHTVCTNIRYMQVVITHTFHTPTTTHTHTMQTLSIAIRRKRSDPNNMQFDYRSCEARFIPMGDYYILIWVCLPGAPPPGIESLHILCNYFSRIRGINQCWLPGN